MTNAQFLITPAEYPLVLALPEWAIGLGYQDTLPTFRDDQKRIQLNKLSSPKQVSLRSHSATAHQCQRHRAQCQAPTPSTGASRSAMHTTSFIDSSHQTQHDGLQWWRTTTRLSGWPWKSF